MEIVLVLNLIVFVMSFFLYVVNVINKNWRIASIYALVVIIWATILGLNGLNILLKR
ncbi:hypothetical protein KBA63_05410 [Candidatus Woesebacteria bacterium]|nr:hypothetical protein [Candidatus Woesebacteria bacterium]